MIKETLLLTVIAAAFAGCATTQPLVTRPLAAATAPVSFDGNVASQSTDYVFMLVPDVSPTTAGLTMHAGDSLRLALPNTFKRNTQVPISPDTDLNLVLTKGWPQGAVRLAGQYRVSYDETLNSMVVTALVDIGLNGVNAPGIKMIHLRGRTFSNPMPGEYSSTVSHTAPNGKLLAKWQGDLKVIDDAPSTRLAPTNFHLAPGTNSDFQRVSPGQTVPHALGLLLWGAQGSALNDVGIAPRDLTRFPRYTGGLLIQDTNHDKRLDPATDRVVGGIIGSAPSEAKGQSASSPTGSDGALVLSGQVLRNAGFGPTGGKPNPGLLAIQFRAGDKPGLYRPTVELIGGNSYQFSIEVVNP
jgi:hypothetical protein